MSKLLGVRTTAAAAALLAFSLCAAPVHAERRVPTLAVTMTNDPASNQIQVHDANSGILLQTLRGWFAIDQRLGLSQQRLADKVSATGKAVVYQTYPMTTVRV